MYIHNFERVNWVGYNEMKISESLAIKTEIVRNDSCKKPFNPCRGGKEDIKAMIMIRQCWRELRLAFLFFFPSILDDYSFLANYVFWHSFYSYTCVIYIYTCS